MGLAEANKFATTAYWEILRQQEQHEQTIKENNNNEVYLSNTINDIEVSYYEEEQDKESKSYKMLEDINSKIAELLEMNPNYKIMLWKIMPDEWDYNKYECKTRLILKDTY